MNQTSLGDNSLQNKLTDAGWNPTINGQGCRPLYNVSNPNGFNGNGTGCPAGTITSAFNEFDKDREQIENAGTIVIALGTNNYERSEAVFIEKAVEYIEMIKGLNSSIGNRIYWVNTYTTDGGKTERSNSIASVVRQTEVQLIDYQSAAINDPTTHSFPGNDVTHNDANGYINKVDFILSNIGPPSGSTSGPSTTGTYDPLSLTYPNFPDEDAIVAGIEATVARRSPSSPWIGLGQWIVDRSKEGNINPLFIVASGGVESGFGTSSRGRTNNNFFGIDKGNRVFSSIEAGIQYYIDIIPKYLSGEEAPVPRYKHVKNIYEYSSVHQVGGIYYPGINEEQSPAPDTGQPMPILDSLESGGMGVYVSWDITDHPNDRYDGNLYNPLAYYELNIGIINEITGLSLPVIPNLGGTSEVGCDGAATLTAGANGWDLPGGENPMVYYSQRTSGDDPAVQGYFGASNYGPGPISHCGCGPTSWSMIVSTLTGKDVKPPEVAEWASANGWQQAAEGGPCGGSNWWWADNNNDSEVKWGVTANQITLDGAANALRSGSLIILSVGDGPFTSGGHLLVMRAVTNDGKYLFADPNDYNDTRPAAANVFNRGSKSRTPLAPEDFSSTINAMWEVRAL